MVGAGVHHRLGDPEASGSSPKSSGGLCSQDVEAINVQSVPVKQTGAAG